MIATASLDGTAKIWCLDTGLSLFQLTAHTDKVTAVVWSLDGRTLATASLDKTCRLWAVTNDEATMKFALCGHSGRITGVVFTPNGSSVITGSTDKTARIWDSKTGACLHECKGHLGSISCICIAPHGRFEWCLSTSCNVGCKILRIIDYFFRMFATSSGDGSIKTWNTKTGACLDDVDWKVNGFPHNINSLK